MSVGQDGWKEIPKRIFEYYGDKMETEEATIWENIFLKIADSLSTQEGVYKNKVQSDKINSEKNFNLLFSFEFFRNNFLIKP